MMSKVSLIPYLEPGDGKFHLSLLPPHTDIDNGEDTRYPFRILNDAEPFSRLFKARLVSGNKQPASHLFLLAQRDSYQYRPDEIRPLNNTDLDTYWQQTFSYVSSQNNIQNRFFPFKDTASPEGGLSPFRSLFFCTQKKCFFHPPCPTCGNHLELCEDDQLLSSKGLLAYTTTLKRYLYCPACPQDSTGFFVYNREDIDPPVAKDRNELIRSWRSISTGSVKVPSFPCADCPEKSACYGEMALSQTRIIPLLFYPSYILAFHANSLNAIDFLSLVSGASIDEIIPSIKANNQSGRLDCLLEWQREHGSGDLFLFSEKPEQFLEILYLKLSFLGDVAGIILTPGDGPAPLDTMAAISSIWVDIPNYNGLLPGLWNFKAGLFTVGPGETGTDTLPGSHPSQIRYGLGIIWFFVLLRNKYQSIRVIQEALKDLRSQSVESIKPNKIPVFAPENNYWSPDAHQPKDIPEAWQTIWETIVALGIRLIQGERIEKEGNGDNLFLAEIERVRQEIKHLLFNKEKQTLDSLPERETSETGGSAPEPTNDAEIHRILTRMIEKWEGSKTPPATPTPSEEETLTQTVVLSADTATALSESVEATAETIGSPISSEEEIQETVMLKPTAEPPEALQETVVLKPNVEPPEEIQETVILKPNTARPLGPETTQSTPPPGEVNETIEQNDMPETLILKPSYNKDKKKGKI